VMLPPATLQEHRLTDSVDLDVLSEGDLGELQSSLVHSSTEDLASWSFLVPTIRVECRSLSGTAQVAELPDGSSVAALRLALGAEDSSLFFRAGTLISDDDVLCPRFGEPTIVVHVVDQAGEEEVPPVKVERDASPAAPNQRSSKRSSRPFLLLGIAALGAAMLLGSQTGVVKHRPARAQSADLMDGQNVTAAPVEPKQLSVSVKLIAAFTEADTPVLEPQGGSGSGVRETITPALDVEHYDGLQRAVPTLSGRHPRQSTDTKRPLLAAFSAPPISPLALPSTRDAPSLAVAGTNAEETEQDEAAAQSHSDTGHLSEAKSVREWLRESSKRVVHLAKKKLGDGRQLGQRAASLVVNALQMLLWRLWRRVKSPKSS